MNGRPSREASGPCVECGYYVHNEPKEDAERRAIHEGHLAALPSEPPSDPERLTPMTKPGRTLHERDHKYNRIDAENCISGKGQRCHALGPILAIERAARLYDPTLDDFADAVALAGMLNDQMKAREMLPYYTKIADKTLPRLRDALAARLNDTAPEEQ